MTDFVSKNFRKAILEKCFLGDQTIQSLYLRLYTDNAVISDSTSLADISSFEQTGGGYSPKAIPLSSDQWISEEVIKNGVPCTQVRLKDQFFTTSADDWGTLRYGVLCTTSDNTGYICAAKDYGTGKTVAGVGANVIISELFFQLDNV